MAGRYLEKYELKIENLPWMQSNEDQKHLEFVLNVDFPSESVKVIEIKEAENGEDFAYVRCKSETTFEELFQRLGGSYNKGPFFWLFYFRFL